MYELGLECSSRDVSTLPELKKLTDRSTWVHTKLRVLKLLAVLDPIEPEFNLHYHCIGSDGTNSSVWKNSTLYVSIVRSTYLRDAVAAQRLFVNGSPPNDIWQQCFAYRKTLADILVQEGKNGCSTDALMRRQLESIGCPLWDEAWCAACRMHHCGYHRSAVHAHTVSLHHRTV